KFFPTQSHLQTTGNYDGMTSAMNCGASAVPGGWKHSDFDDTQGTIGVETSGFPDTPQEIRRSLFEATAFGGVIGLHWAIRSRPEHLCDTAADLLTTYLEHPTILDATRQTLAFIHALPVFGDTRNLA